MTHEMDTDWLTRSVVAVPPLARGADLSVDEPQNARIIRHVESGGVRTLLYGGNANFYHVGLVEYEQVLSFLERSAGADTLVIPSAGPAFGMMMEQAKLLRRHRFPAVMVLPQQGIATPDGVEAGIRRFVQAAGTPALLYVKDERYLEPSHVGRLARDGIICGIKYAVVRPDPSADDYLRRLTGEMESRSIISGIGEQPAAAHLRDFGLGGFTSGCVCVAPRLSTAMLQAIRARDWGRAERIRQLFKPLEDLRNALGPIQVLHEAVRLAGIAQTGPMLPLMSNVPEAEQAPIREAAERLLAHERDANSSTDIA